MSLSRKSARVSLWLTGAFLSPSDSCSFGVCYFFQFHLSSGRPLALPLPKPRALGTVSLGCHQPPPAPDAVWGVGLFQEKPHSLQNNIRTSLEKRKRGSGGPWASRPEAALQGQWAVWSGWDAGVGRSCLVLGWARGPCEESRANSVLGSLGRGRLGGWTSTPSHLLSPARTVGAPPATAPQSIMPRDPALCTRDILDIGVSIRGGAQGHVWELRPPWGSSG